LTWLAGKVTEIERTAATEGTDRFTELIPTSGVEDLLVVSGEVGSPEAPGHTELLSLKHQNLAKTFPSELRVDHNGLNEDLSGVSRNPTDPGVTNHLQLASSSPLD